MKKIGIDQLLEMILLQAELLELKADPDGHARGVVIEARREAGQGTSRRSSCRGNAPGRRRLLRRLRVGRLSAMLDDHGATPPEAGPATPAEIMGFEELPAPGDLSRSSRARSAGAPDRLVPHGEGAREVDG